MSRQNIPWDGGRLRLCPTARTKRQNNDSGEQNNCPLEKLLCTHQHQFHPYLYRFGQIGWAVFGTLTWADARRRSSTERSEQFRRKDFHDLIGVTCARLKLRRKNIAFYHATEWGAGECHLHFLIAKDGLKQLSPAMLAETMGHLWRSEFRSFDSRITAAGIADVQPYDAAQGVKGVAYCLKREHDFHGDERERFDYISPNLMKLLTRAANKNSSEDASVPVVPSLGSSGRGF